VTRGPSGKVQSLRYLELTALLLNELQKQTTKIADWLCIESGCTHSVQMSGLNLPRAVVALAAS
jgi:hypothetical protein